MTSFKKTMSDDAKITFMEALTFVLNIEDRKTPLQQEYLLRQAFECGLPARELKLVKNLKKPDDLIKRLREIPDKKTKRFIIREMIMMAVADRELTDTEMCTIYEIGTGAGLKQEKINDFFLWAAKGIEWQIEGAHMVEDD
ncbi:MAG: hypothetical protein KHX55_08260 [Proteobacteria bacterium]|nr:hypothetical protein [Pseudomonadota bacterium]